jgi:ornithine cyclodeaminase/alanine dehydrogenase-like protein (mu-crystallin family)
MKIITSDQIKSLSISPVTCINWVKEDFLLKDRAQLPAKMSVHPKGNDFFTTMPCLLPVEYHRFGDKVVSRILGNKPSLKSDLMLFDTKTGELLCLMDSNWITSMRTGAVATLAIKTFRKSDAKNYSFVGLGSTAHATLLCLLYYCPNDFFNIKLLKYKDQAEKFCNDFSSFKNVSFNIVNKIEDLVVNADVLVSCITDANNLLIEDISLFKEGILIVPVHTRGFQNCDLFFDKIFADDTAHVEGFKYFHKFKYFDEFSNVLSGKSCGRLNNSERILSYNIGLGLHDVFFASQIYDLLV